ncbi:uncharacterized protein DUF1311 [Nitrospirillum pindoramense]|uniref:Uncharacterized protein DUF1311 n=2 Tax=Nitrospirillum amazonense TaxID=28077 RepID=A0A560GVR4_9PROT|nr:uncharacterized protein DUF1311 [Nitrospirillum amazonense]
MLARLAPLAAALLLMCAPLGVQAAVNAGEGPSFNCAAAATTVEKAICGDANLSALDRQMNETYQQAVQAASSVAGPWKEAVFLAQRIWLSQRSECFLGSSHDAPDSAGVICLGQAYEAQVERVALIGDSLRKSQQNILLRRQNHVIEQPGDVDRDLKFLPGQLLRPAFSGMLAAPKAAEGLFRLFQTTEARLGLAVVLRVTASDPKAHDAEIRQLLTKVSEAKDDENVAYFSPKPEGYDGTIGSLVIFMRAAAGSAEFPCEMYERHPELIDAMAAEFGSSQDGYLPNADCGARAYALPGSVFAIEQALSAFDGGAFDRCTGTMGSMYRRRVRLADVAMQVAPRRLLAEAADPDEKNNSDHDLRIMPLLAWSYDSPWNRQKFMAIRDLFLKARTDLAVMYRGRYGLKADEALLAAHIGLNNRFDWTLRGRPNALRAAIMDADAKPSLAEVLASGPLPQIVDAEPLLSLAVARPASLAALLAAGAPVDGTNPIGKTPLMTAAQFNALEAVQALLKAKAAVNRQSLAPDRIEGNDPPGEGDMQSACGTYAITHGQRTALMYAAANAGLPVIEALLAAGADTALKDSTGLTALDYLEGRGPVPANPLLTGAELATARTLLTPRGL